MRRLRSRLDRLEAESRQGKLSAGAADMLAALYGRLHAMFLPSRSHPSSWSAVRRLRRDYINGTTGISARSPGAKDWVAGHDCRRELVAAGYADAVRGDVETTGLRLTPLGRTTALAMVLPAIPAVPLGEAFTEALSRLPADRLRGDEKWVAESSLFGIDCVGDTSKWDHFTDIMLEPSISGAVDSLADIRGSVFYRFIGPFEPLPTVEGIEPSDGAIDVYVDAFKSELPRLRRLEATDGEIVIPLSVTS